ncbi:adenine phosphoribosyltransferase-like protein [Leptotrombidium deliense]|uniref:Adenine phosphoribosyltransferase n=1 Tax=Leptotrombidium deliense TaxID=299467 RepID=A0A443S5F9_9ACAR|nr:adenine phosphoribosyltransferase-like protein [Leptotrombidium deliense]
MTRFDKMAVDERVEKFKSYVKSYPDWPKAGVIFRDLFPVFQKPEVLRNLIDLFKEHIKENFADVQAIVGLESRGFLFAPILALELNISFIPIRKQGKMPGKLRQSNYTLEYGEDTIEIQEECITPNMKCIIADDLLATGGTMKAAISLLQQCNADVKECLVVIESPDLNGRKKLTVPVFSVLKF